jgi:hypothetical protein
MKRLNFILPEFTRVSWVRENLRQVWEPRINKIQYMWKKLEWKSVVSEIRPCSLIYITPEEYVKESIEWLENGLICLPAQIEGMNSSGYLNRSLAYRPGYPFLYRMILSRKDKDAISLKEARKSYDNNKIGQMLGYPECCCKFFYNTYVKEHYIDITWPMAVGKITSSNNFVEIPAIAAESNILWR